MKFECECNYCNMNTFLWELDTKEVWVEIPKNASYNLKQILYKYDSRYSVESQPNSKISKINHIDINNHKNGFVILRNPIERFKSLIAHYFISGSRVDAGTAWIDKFSVGKFNENNIVNLVLDNWENISNIREPHHFNSQSSFIPNNFFELESYKVYNLNEVNKIFGLSLGVNSSGSSKITLDSYCVEKLKNLYESDFNLYEKYLVK